MPEPQPDRFSRPDREGGGRQLTDLGCPDCPGVLSASEEGNKGFLRFTCRIGHAFSAASLVEAQERELERCLWSAVVALEQIIALDQEVALRSADAAVRGGLERRVANARAQVEEVRRVIARNEPATEIDCT